MVSGSIRQLHRNEMRGGVEAALNGASTLVTPSLLFMGLLGPLAATPSLWGTLLAITLVPVVRLLLGGSGVVLVAPRTASTATYVAMILHMGLAGTASPVGNGGQLLSAHQLRTGLAIASLMYLFASVLVAFSGLIKLGRVFKMIPNPVSSGISNGTALLLLTLAVSKASEGGVFAVLTALTMVMATFGWGWLQQRKSLARLVPGILIAICMGLLGSIGWSSGLQESIAAPSSNGMLEGVNWMSIGLWQSLDTSNLGALLMLGIPGTITLALVMVLESFTTSSVMEMRFGCRLQADRELIALGGANILGALLGGLPCSGSAVFSVSCWLGGGRGRVASLWCFALSGVVLVFFSPWLIALPAGLAAGLLVLQALLMVNPVFMESLWLVLRTHRWQKPGAQDLGFWITVAISLVGYFGNLIWACFAGVGLSCLAVLRRVSANLTAHWIYLDTLRSRRIRTAAQADALAQLARHVGVLRLTGHLFFGNSGRITQLVEELDEDCLCVVIDVTLVHDADPSGLDALTWLARTLRDRNVRVVVSGLDKTRVEALRNAMSKQFGLEQCVDLDRGLEYCEEWVLKHATKLPEASLARPIEGNSLLQGLTEEEITAVLMVVDVRHVHQGEVLFHKDERSDGVWLLQDGQVSILAGQGPLATRLATFGPGQFVGEMGFIDGNVRSATATADSPVEAVLLDNNAIAALVRDHPQAALTITRNVARELSQRVRSTSAFLTQETEAPSSIWASSALGMGAK